MKSRNFSSRQAQWSTLITLQQGSGESVRSFCQSRGITTSAFYDWRARLKKKSSDLIPIEIAQEKKETFRVILKSGVALEFSERPEPEWIKALLEVVQ